MWKTPLTFAILLCACGDAQPITTSDADADADTDADTDTDTDTDTPISEFREGFWLVTSLAIVEDTDLDDDGVVDNKLPEILVAIDELLRDEPLSVEAINTNIQANIDNFVTVVFLEGRSDGEDLALDVLNGFSIDGSSTLAVSPSSYDDQGDALSTLTGSFSSNTDFSVFGDLEMVVTMVSGVDPAPVRVESVTIEGLAGPGAIGGRMHGILPVDAFIDDVVASMIPEEGLEIFPGTLSTKEEILDLVRSIAPGLADATLPSGEAGVTAAFELSAGSWTLTP